MADCDESSVSSSFSEKFQLIDLKLPTLSDQKIRSQVQQTHTNYYAQILRQPLLASISHVLKPAIIFVDSILRDNKVIENKIDELETINLLEFDSTLSELSALVGDRSFTIHTLLERGVPDEGIELGPSILQEFSTISELKTLAEHDYFIIPAVLMERTANNAVQTFDEINVHLASMDLLEFLSHLSWDAKAVNTMGCFVFKFLEFLGFLLHGSNQPLTALASSMAALKENPVSIMGSPLEKYQQPLDQLNSLINITLEVIQYICELTLLSDIEHNTKDLLSTCAHWAILSVSACYIQITLINHNGGAALELSHMISNLSHILDDLKHHCTICKPQIEEIEGHMQSISVLIEVIFDYEKRFSDTHTDILELMKRFTYSKDGHQSIIDGSTMSKVDLEVLNDKAVLFFISDLDISTNDISDLLKIYEKIREEDYYKIVWIPFVLKWTEELRLKFDNLKSKMPWYIVSYESPFAGLWYIKGRWFFKEPSVVLIDPRQEKKDPANTSRLRISGGRLIIAARRVRRATRPVLQQLYSAWTEIIEQHQQEVVVQQKNPSSGFAGLLSKSKNIGGSKQGGSSRKN